MVLLVLAACSKDAPPPAAAALPETVRYARLTHREWENTVVDLLHLPGPTGLSSTFLADPPVGRFDDDAATLEVTPELRQDYQRAAESLAARVTGDLALYAAVVPQDVRLDPPFLDRREGDDPRLARTGGAVVGTDFVTDGLGASELQTTFAYPEAGTGQLSVRLWADGAAPLTLGIGGAVVDLRVGPEPVVLAVEGALDPGDVVATLTSPSATRVTVDWIALGAFAAPLGSTASGPAERDAWIASFGERALRRPLTAAESARYTALFEAAPTLSAGADPFSEGVSLVLEGMLQSPSFLYRAEPPGPDLDAWSLASRLSYALWESMPDDALTAAARSGALSDPDELRTQAERLLDDPRAEAVVGDFARQLLELDGYAFLVPDPSRFPDAGPTLTGSMEQEGAAFVEGAVLGGGSVRDLLTSTHTIVDADLAPIYGVRAPDVGWADVALDPTQRAGLLTLSGFLAATGDGRDHHPIRRGVYVDQRILCLSLPPPPAAVSPAPPIGPTSTTREQIEALTGDGTCGEGCHSTLINPIGFAYEHYDALGEWQDTENGAPVDASATFGFEDGARSYDGAVALAAILADEPAVHRCLVAQLLEFTHGRALAPEDAPLVEALADRSREDDLPLRDLVLDLVTDPSFRTRAAPAP